MYEGRFSLHLNTSAGSVPGQWGLSGGVGAPAHLHASLLSITRPTPASSPPLPPPLVPPQHNYSQHDKRQAPSAEISKKHRPLLNEATLAAPCSRAYRRASSAPGRLVPPPSHSTGVPSSWGLVRGATWRGGPAWFISLAPPPGHSGRPKEPTRLQRALAGNPGISWNKPSCRPVKNVLWLAN